jgi:hypothetical protein
MLPDDGLKTNFSEEVVTVEIDALVIGSIDG